MNNTLSENLERIKDAVADIRGIVDCQEGTIEEVATAVGSSIQHNATEKDVNFYDYDGTCLYSYTRNEMLEATELPSNPTHKGLVAQGWNWSLQNIKTRLNSIPGFLSVGQNYTTDDGSSRFHIFVDEYTKDLYVHFATTGTVDINFGDGSVVESVTGSSSSALLSIHHVYSKPGRYTISLTPKSGNIYLTQTGGLGFYLVGPLSINSNNRYDYKKCIESANLGSNICLYQHAFTDSSIQTISIPTDISFDSFVFYQCYNLRCLIIPNGITQFRRGNVTYDYSLKTLSLPSTINYMNEEITLSTNLLYYEIPLNLTSYYVEDISIEYSSSVPKCIPDIVYFPQGISTITGANYRLNQNIYFKIKYLDFQRHISIPTMNLKKAIIGSLLEIRVPYNLYENWVVANNWGSLAPVITPYSEGSIVPHSAITLAVDSNLSNTTINVSTKVYKLNTSGYTIPSFSDITTTESEENLEWSDGTNTYGFGNAITLSGNITLTLRSKE